MAVKVPYFSWREGRPRWVPGPHLRAAGFQGQDLKDAAGGWLPLGEAIERAQKLNAAVAASKTSSTALVPATGISLPAILPPVLLPKVERCVAKLADRYKLHGAFSKKALKTQKGYDYHLRLICEILGDLHVDAVSLESIEDFYTDLSRDKGLATANAVYRTGKLLFNYGIKHEWLEINRWEKLETGVLAGRLVVWTYEEIKAFIAAAEALGWISQVEAMLLGLLTGQRQADILGLTEISFADGVLTLRQKKTGARVRIPLVPQLKARLAGTLMRDRIGEVTPETSRPILICETTREPWKADYFRHVFGAIRAKAGEVCPSILDKRYSDLRDTAVTWLARAGATIPEIATVTGHSLKTIHEILDKHYLVRDDALGEAAAAKLTLFFNKTGIG